MLSFFLFQFKLAKMTVEKLKGYLTHQGVEFKNAKKADLMELVKTHLSL